MTSLNTTWYELKLIHISDDVLSLSLLCLSLNCGKNTSRNREIFDAIEAHYKYTSIKIKNVEFYTSFTRRKSKKERSRHMRKLVALRFALPAIVILAVVTIAFVAVAVVAHAHPGVATYPACC